MVTICLQCGVEGWKNAFVYCVKCLNKAVHRYCLDELPKTFDEFVRFVCDVCEAESQRTTNSDSDDKSQETTSSKQIDVDCTIKPSKKIISNLTESVENGHCENDNRSPMVLVENEARLPVNSSQLHGKKRKEAVVNGASRKAKLRKLNDDSLSVSTKNQSYLLASVSPMETKDGQDTNCEKETKLLEEPIVAAGESCIRAKPLVDPIWRGNFIILNDTIEGLAAHLSSKACRMVYNEASLLQTSLRLKILPRNVVWPKSFEKTEPTDDNIAMYILPIDSRYAKSYDLLVTKMTKQELAMKAITKDAELLIFTSTELPLSYWKFGDKCYLWGVFRGKPSLLSSRATGDPVVPI